MTLFAEVKSACADQPETLPDLAIVDPYVRELCARLLQAMNELAAAEVSRSSAFAAPVGRAFQKAWRDCLKRYGETLFFIPAKARREDGGGGWTHASPELLHQISPELNRRIATASAHQADFSFALAKAALYLFKDQIETGWEQWQADKPDPTELDIGMALESWGQLVDTVGLDIPTAFRRRQLLPFTLVPQEVQLVDSGNTRLSLLRLLEDAQRAFVFGSTLSAIGLMRSVLESVLRDHYNPWDSKLVDLIDNATGLPAHVKPARLHALRLMANTILHPSPNNRGGFVDLREEKLEKEIISLFYVLRDLIEGIPEGSKR
ncbi:hypothetical protein MCEMIH15_00686 [Caulobacteraceae bacterium]